MLRNSSGYTFSLFVYEGVRGKWLHYLARYGGAWSILIRDRFTPSWEGPSVPFDQEPGSAQRSVLEVLEERKIYCPCTESNPGLSIPPPSPLTNNGAPFSDENINMDWNTGKYKCVLHREDMACDM
jgi:hypothetical protein